MEQTKVSVIVPCYNGESFITRCIESIYTQDYSNIELIVVDDGSTDGSKQAISAWEKRFTEKGYTLKYVYQENRGLGGAIDTGLKHVTGDYLSLLDADDYFLSGSISKRASFLDLNSDYAGVRSNGWQICGLDKKLFVTSDEEKLQTDYFYGYFFIGLNNWAGSYMVRTNLLFDFYPDRNIYPSRFGQNLQILLPVSYKRKFGFIDEPLMAYVLRENSLSQAATDDEKWEKDNKNFYGYFDIYQHMINLVVQDEKEKSFYQNRINSWLYRHECKSAVRNKDIQKLKTNFNALLATGYATLNDKIDFYSILNPIKAFICRVLRRLKMILHLI